MIASRNDDLGYPIVVGDDIEPEIRSFLNDRAGRFVVLCDRNVAPLARRLTRSAARITVLPFELGERRKTLQTVEAVLGALQRAGADRATTIVGVGGGVASDLFGLCAALYMRGVPYAHIATSLVAMVDAAVGGKTGVDLPEGKNLAGVFRDPIAVFAPIEALYTLPLRHVREGLAEVIKHAIIEGGEAFEMLERLAPHPFARWPWEAVVCESVKVKAMFVADDRLEAGSREVLNLGHTFGHAIERASGYRVSHGAAVSIGLRAAGLLAIRHKRFSRTDHLRVLGLLALLQMPTWTRVRAADIVAAMSSDKKKRDGRLRFVLPHAIGDVEHGINVPLASVRRTAGRLVTPPGEHEFVI